MKTIKNELNQLKKSIELIERLTTFKGFVMEYFNQLKTSTSEEIAFQKVNALYKSIIGVNRYDNYKQFNNTKNLFLKS